MEKKQNLKYKRCLKGVGGILWVAGLLIAGSDSPYMPWINGTGLILFFCASILFGKVLQSIESENDNIIPRKLTERPPLCLKIRFSE